MNMMAYRIAWKSTYTGFEACGKDIFKNYEDAVEAVNMANHVNPGIKHWVEEVV
jgi:hypothetical protein